MKLIRTENSISPEEIAEIYDTDAKTVTDLLNNPDHMAFVMDIYLEALDGGWLVE